LERALDADGDGEISSDEIEGAVAALKKLDQNGDGKLAGDEIRPKRPPMDGNGPGGDEGRPRDEAGRPRDGAGRPRNGEGRPRRPEAGDRPEKAAGNDARPDEKKPDAGGNPAEKPKAGTQAEIGG
jgi:hypothetical protein